VALKILLADDSMTAQNMGKKILVDAGYDVIAVSNGAAAIKKISSEHPDIAILDEYMPGYTGSEVCERVKASAETSKMPVLLTVGKMEAFDPEKANKVHADGVMIKPFEASDLIAAVQAISQRLLAPAPPRGLEVGTVQLRQGQGVSIEDTQRIAASFPADASHEDTLRVGPPKASTASHEETLRMTAQQIKAFQDATYHDWKNTAEPHLEEHEKGTATAETAEIPVTPPVPEPAAPAMAAAMMVEPPAAARETPVFSAMAASGVAAEHAYLSGSTGPAAPVEEPAEAAPAMPVFYTPPVVEEEPPSPPPAFVVAPEPTLAEPVTSPVVAEVAPALEPETAPVVAGAPVMEVAPAPLMVEPEISPVAPIVQPVMEVAAPTPTMEAAPVLETSAPLMPGPMAIAPIAELEPTIAPAVDVAPAAAHELEITSPPQEHGGVVPQDSGLVTSSEDMTQFATKFGVEGAESIPVGVVSELSEEQMAAIVTPVEPAVVTAPESAVAEPAVMEVPFAAPEPKPVVVAEPALADTVVAPTAPVTPAIETAVSSPAAASPVEEEVGAIQAVEPFEAEEPIVAYVPGIDDSQPFTAMREPEPEPEAVAVAPAPVAAPEPVVEAAVVQPIVAAVPEPEVAPVIPEQPAVLAEPEPIVAEPEPVVAEATVAQPEEHVPAAVASLAQAVHTEALAPVETGLAAAAGVAAAAVAAVVHAMPAHVEEPAVSEPAPAQVREPEPTVPAAVQHREPVGDAALAEELAAALATKETDERVKAAAEAALHPAAMAAVAPVADMGPQTVPDEKLAEAVARAFDHLKPQLIAEIVKHLNK